VVGGANRFHANLGGESETEELLKNIANGKSQNNRSFSGDAAQSSSAESRSDVPTTSYHYTPTYSKQNATNEIIAAAAPVVTELVNQWNANYDRKEAKRKAEQDVYYKNLFERRREKFKNVYLPLESNAVGGNIHARLILFFASEIYNAEELVPERDKWFQEALENNNQDALLYQNYTRLNAKEINTNQYFAYIKKLAERGNVDAIVTIGGHHSLEIGPDPHPDAAKSLAYLNLAAEKGSAVAMYKLGMIYKYGIVAQEYRRFYTSFKEVVKQDEKTAFEWFTKALQAKHELSLYERAVYGNNLLDAVKGSYAELSKIYKEGKVVPKDKAKAKELAEYNDFEYILSQKYGYQKD